MHPQGSRCEIVNIKNIAYVSRLSDFHLSTKRCASKDYYCIFAKSNDDYRNNEYYFKI